MAPSNVRANNRKQTNLLSGSRDGGVNKSNGQKAACDRCRGQKLRCTWNSKESECQRCQRANAICTIPLPRPMGCPRRQHRSASSHNQGHDVIFIWADERTTATVSCSEDTAVAMSSTESPADPLDFLTR